MRNRGAARARAVQTRAVCAWGQSSATRKHHSTGDRSCLLLAWENTGKVLRQASEMLCKHRSTTLMQMKGKLLETKPF